MTNALRSILSLVADIVEDSMEHDEGISDETRACNIELHLEDVLATQWNNMKMPAGIKELITASIAVYDEEANIEGILKEYGATNIRFKEVTPNRTTLNCVYWNEENGFEGCCVKIGLRALRVEVQEYIEASIALGE